MYTYVYTKVYTTHLSIDGRSPLKYSRSLLKYNRSLLTDGRRFAQGINVVMVTPDEQTKAVEYMRVLNIQPSNYKMVSVDRSGAVPEDLRSFVEAAQH